MGSTRHTMIFGPLRRLSYDAVYPQGSHQPRRVTLAAEAAKRSKSLNKRFTAILEKSAARGGWTYVVWPESADFFGTRGRVKVRATIDGYPFSSSFMALGDGTQKLPVKTDVRRAIGKEPGDAVTVTLLERLA